MKRAYLAIACDTDPDLQPTYAKAPADPGHLWRGISEGVAALRRHLPTTAFARRYGQLPITWLLRCDRQIREIYGEPAFCYDHFARVWAGEVDGGNEIGWHPHLYRWDVGIAAWVPYLHAGDDLEVLEECLAALRRRTPIEAVRTGWDYHSNALMHFFDRHGLRVDASAIPESVQSGTWHHDWQGAPRRPYAPSRHDYRVPSASADAALGIVELPVLVRRLPLPLRAVRFGLRNARALKSRRVPLSGWRSAGWQGVVITGSELGFVDAVRLALADEGPAFVSTYFHTGALLSAVHMARLGRNLDAIVSLARSLGWELEPVTLSAAAAAARPLVDRALAR